MIMCVAGDPGGSRAVLPIAEVLWQKEETVRVPCHGTLARELPPALAAGICGEKEAFSLLPHCKAVIFGSSTDDVYPLTLARAARSGGAVVMHVLDNWSSYLRRLCTDGLPPLEPDIYAVMDEQAREGAIAEGVSAACLVVTGHPGLAVTAAAVEKLLQEGRTRQPHLHGRMPIAFISEPFTLVFGRDCGVHEHPGFTEESVLTDLAAALAPHAASIFVHLVPHPKQRAEDVSRVWQRVCGPLEGSVISLPLGRDILGKVSGVAGMASILLYEGWLGGLPVLSLQPDCRMPALRRFASLEGVCYAATVAAIPTAVEHWLAQCRGALPAPRNELFLHKAAPRKAAEILLQHMRKSA